MSGMLFGFFVYVEWWDEKIGVYLGFVILYIGNVMVVIDSDSIIVKLDVVEVYCLFFVLFDLICNFSEVVEIIGEVGGV